MTVRSDDAVITEKSVEGDKLADGVVKTVTPQGLVVLQDISDPLSAQKQREVRKLLRSLEDAKEKL